MQVELWDIDVPYTLTIDTNDAGRDFVGLMVEGQDDYTLSLSKSQCVELARTLMFLSKQIKEK